MMARRGASNAKSWFFVYVDDGARAFDVFGPITDDSSETDVVAARQQSGRRVRCFTVPSAGKTAEQIATDYSSEQTGLVYKPGLFRRG